MEWTDDEIAKWRKAGQISAEALKYGKSLIKKGVSLLEVTEKTEEKILSLGGGFAFPVKISCNNIAAHYCAEPNDSIILEDQLCSLDLGAEVDGFIGDTATTVDLSGKYSDL